ncbi:MAG: GNAT family N-acetyltransferase [Syntrophobacteraceae bacterium]|nr:GNAT family N-acetyltransferase [Syntrophobacteraceae bacterium]
MNEMLAITKLAVTHDPADFDCDSEELNNFIRLYALAGQRASISQTYVAVYGVEIVGYHTLVVGEIVYDDAPERLAKGLPRYPVPTLLLARLAVDCRWQGKGLGAALVADAMRRTLQVADIAGVRALLVHAKDDTARSFYMHLGFEVFPDEPFVLYRLVKDIRAMQKKP